MAAQTMAAKPDPAAAPGLAAYPVDVGAGDLYRDAAPDVAQTWQRAAQSLLALREEAGVAVQELVGRQILDLGMSFRLTGEDDERDWPLSPMPLIVGAQEWAEVERGLVQRARLLEAVVDDIYGEGRLVADGHLPAALIAGSRYFARSMVGVAPRSGPHIHVYAVDLARGPRGQWRVLGDRLRLANGIGYALENRLALSRVTGGLLTDMRARRLAQFFSDLRGGIARECQRENPRIALLTPGRFNQSYPEQAHLARYLGFPLVEGRDLTVSDDRVYVRTIAGPKRVDAVWRWIDTNALDPLRFDARSEIGVPDLFEALDRGGLTLANWPGAEVLEAPAFAAFMPRLFSVLLGEAPILPNVATWWCGQPREAQDVAARLDQLMITPAFGAGVEGLPHGRAVAGRSLDKAQRGALLAAMARRPVDYCGQEIVTLSTTPALIGEAFVPRAFTVRAFVARNAAGEWTVMPGGFARLSSSGEMVNTMMGEGDISADVCVVDTKADAAAVNATPSALGAPPPVRRGGGILASQAADNLFWFGRYVERAEATVRIIRAVLGNSIEVDAAAGHSPEVIARLVDLMVTWGALSREEADLPMPQACAAALSDTAMNGSVGALFAAIRATALTLRDRFTTDFWRIASRPLPPVDGHRAGALLRTARELIERLSALSGLLAENFTLGPSRHFLDMGRRLERAVALCQTLRALSARIETPEALGVLLDLSDSQITYRARYLAAPSTAPVLDLLLLDPTNPRSLAFQAQALVSHIEALPALREDNLPEAPLLEARAILAPLSSLPVEAWNLARLAEAEQRLLTLSDTISTRYFLQFEKAGGGASSSLLA
ncbi:circularly permuted type 2 ATP-grasp protein [Novosphingobium sp. AAP1]|uniref:circularly permuted type 2 ATP-grasp protein n=2 Tax=unclassified Novosphingobium TaxID=2644732 RepID=UPI000A4D5DE3|nr:circularly permuted type 2 ATP-grasp protein [Novosphingobium sp. AAP1]